MPATSIRSNPMIPISLSSGGPVLKTTDFMENETSESSSPTPIATSPLSDIRTTEMPGADPLDVRLFEPAALSAGGLVVVRAKLSHVLHSNPLNGIQTLLSKPKLFEYMYSVLDDASAHVIVDFFIKNFPSSSKEFHNSIFSKVLLRIAEFMFCLASEEDMNGHDSLHSSHYLQKVKSGIRALDVIAENPSFLGAVHDSDSTTLDSIEGEFLFANSARIRVKRQGKQIRHQRTRKSISIDPLLLKIFEEDAPTCPEETDLLTKKILGELLNIMQKYLSDLRSPILENPIRRQYFPENLPTGFSQGAKVLQNAKPPTHTPDENRCVSSTNLIPANQSADSVFPLVQPLKASLYFDSVEGFGDWRVYVSTRAEKHLREHRKNQSTLKIIIKKIKELSRGHFSPFDNQKRLSGPDGGIPMFEAKLTGDLRLVYQVDCISDYGSEVERQAIKVYGIFTHAQMNKNLWEYLSTHLQNKGKEYCRRVTYRKKPEVTGDNVFLPESWPPEKMEDGDATSNIPFHMDAARLQDIHEWTVLEKYVALSQTLLTCILAEQEVSHVFNVSPYEREIIEHDSSCYVIGRSGTGKTTTMLFKIFGIERASKDDQHIATTPRQLFITQSRVLAGRVEECYKKLAEFLQTAYMSEEELLKRRRSKKEEIKEELVDRDEEEWHEDLPKQFSRLQDKHFPLFLTFDKLCSMLEADLDLSFARQKYTKEHKRAQRRFEIGNISVHDGLSDEDDIDEDEESKQDILSSSFDSTIENKNSSLVTYDTFLSDYWPHLPQSLTKNLDSALVFSEIMGVIKGSEDSLLTEKGFISRSNYLQLSHRTQSTFSTARCTIYDLFEAYQKRKATQRDYDLADRTHSIIRGLRESNVKFQKLDFLYVDEAQDNLIIDAHLLRSLCSNPHGLFWAGDTAQTIAIGSSFRFNDLKSFLHRVEELNEVDPVKPSSFQLTVNYRSHGGIVSCADSVIQLITKFWPYSIDQLRREKGAVEGSKPLFIVGWEDNTLRYEQFLFGDSGNTVEFGAQQCILVRNDAARDSLRKQVGVVGVILTLYESKGLEFDDVLLLNFFEDSSCDASQWRVILNALQIEALHGQPVPTFDDIRHAGICTELKFLYVAMTRARKNLWIVDRSDKGLAMRAFFETNGLVQLCTPDLTPALAVSSSKEEWEKMGRSLFSNKRYHQAMHCFDRAGLKLEMRIAHAYFLRQQARSFGKTARKERKLAFSIAADEFVECAHARYNASYWRIAGECFVQAENLRRAAEAFFEAKLYTDSAKHFKKANLFDEAVEVVRDKGEFIAEHVIENIMDVSRVHYLRLQKLEKVVALFDSADEALLFVEDYGSGASRAVILEKLGRFEEAGQINVDEGSIEDAVRLFRLANNSQASTKAATTILNSLRDVFTFGSQSGKRVEAERLLLLGKEVEQSHLSAETIDEFALFCAINDSSSSQMLMPLCDRFFGQYGNPVAALLCLDQLLQRLQKSDMDSPERTTRVLSLFSTYVELARLHIWGDKDCITKEPICRLLAIRRNLQRDFEFTVLENSMLSKFKLQSRRFDVLHDVDSAMDAEVLTRLIKDAVSSHLCEVFRAVDSLCERSRAFVTPCLNHAVHGSCFLSGCERDHVNPLKIQFDWFMDRLRIHLLMVACVQAVDFALDPFYKETLHRSWLGRISQLMFPARHTLGSAGILESFLVQDSLRTSLNIVQAWAHETALTWSPEKRNGQFLDVIAQMSNFSFWYNRNATHEFMQRMAVPFLSGERQKKIPQLSDGSFYFPPNLVSAIGLTFPASISHGVSFLRFMLCSKPRLPMNVLHLTELIEHLCGSLAVLSSNSRSALHGLMLPKSWLLILFRKLDFALPYALGSHRNILDEVKHLMELLSNTESFDGYPQFGHIPMATRVLCINRLCRAVVLLGYNVSDEAYRYHVLHTLRKMRLTQKSVHQLNKGFLDDRIKHWGQLCAVVRKSISGSYLDEMVQILKKGERPLTEFDCVRQVTVQQHDDVISALAHEKRSTTLSAAAAPFLPRTQLKDANDDPIISDASNEATSRSDDEDIPEINEILEDEDETPPTEIAPVAQASRELSKEDMAPDVTRQASPEELNAVARIEAAYTHALHQSRLRLTTKSSTRSKRVRQHFSVCLQSIDCGPWPSRYRKMFFLGILPHILTCLDHIVEKTTETANKAKKQLAVGTDKFASDYDSFLERISKYTKLQRAAIKLRKDLLPSVVCAKLHGKDDFDFKGVCTEVQSLANALGGIGPFDEDLAIMTKAILRERRITIPKRTKPSLNVEDLV